MTTTTTTVKTNPSRKRATTVRSGRLGLRTTPAPGCLDPARRRGDAEERHRIRPEQRLRKGGTNPFGSTIFSCIRAIFCQRFGEFETSPLHPPQLTLLSQGLSGNSNENVKYLTKQIFAAQGKRRVVQRMTCHPEGPFLRSPSPACHPELNEGSRFSATWGILPFGQDDRLGLFASPSMLIPLGKTPIMGRWLWRRTPYRGKNRLPDRNH